MSLARRLLIPARGLGHFAPSVPLNVEGPYDPATDHSERVLTQLHCHTNQSDGAYSPQAIVDYYAARGYGALQITDHDKITAQPAGITTAIPGNEHSPTTQHIIAINSPTYTRGGVTDAQQIIDAVAADGGLSEVAHPKWYRGMTSAELAALTGYAGFEIHNGHCVDGAGQNPVTYPGFAVDLWDELLRDGHRPFGFSVDDLHSIGAYDAPDVGRVQVFAASNTASALASAIAAGNFVADVSNYGVTPAYPTRSATGISLACTGATRIEAWGASGLLGSGASLDYAYTGAEEYVRLVAVGDYTEGFDALSDRWIAVDGTWLATGGELTLSTDATARRLILRRHVEGDFTAQVDLYHSDVSTDDSGALMFHVLNGNYYYMVKIGPSSSGAFNGKLVIGRTTSNSFANSSTALASAAFPTDPDTWYTVKVDYARSTSTIRAKAWLRGDPEPDWMVSVVHGEWKHGAFGLRANRACRFDNLYIDGFRTYYQPVSVS